MYELNYLEEKNKFFSYMENFKNIKLIGRGGLFWYNNMDECIAQALEVAEEISNLNNYEE